MQKEDKKEKQLPELVSDVLKRLDVKKGDRIDHKALVEEVRKLGITDDEENKKNKKKRFAKSSVKKRVTVAVKNLKNQPANKGFSSDDGIIKKKKSGNTKKANKM